VAAPREAIASQTEQSTATVDAGTESIARSASRSPALDRAQTGRESAFGARTPLGDDACETWVCAKGRMDWRTIATATAAAAKVGAAPRDETRRDPNRRHVHPGLIMLRSLPTSREKDPLKEKHSTEPSTEEKGFRRGDAIRSGGRDTRAIVHPRRTR